MQRIEHAGWACSSVEDSVLLLARRAGVIELRLSETSQIPEAMHEDPEVETPGRIPTTGSEAEGVQVLIEVEDRFEDRVWGSPWQAITRLLGPAEKRCRVGTSGIRQDLSGQEGGQNGSSSRFI